VVESTGFEIRRACKRTVGSNPTLSATLRPDGLRVAGPRNDGPSRTATASPRCHPALNLMDDASLRAWASQGRALRRAAKRQASPVLELPRPEGKLAGMRFKPQSV
jgi:hypothetical protein